MQKVTVIKCGWCGDTVDRPTSYFRRVTKSGKFFCSKSCRMRFQNDSRKSIRIVVKCEFCDKESRKIPYSVNNSKKHFCSMKCYSSYKKGSNHPRWLGGRKVDKDGYVLVYKPTHVNADIRGYIREHREVLENDMGRLLEKSEVVHHIDGDKGNNKVENLMLFGNHGEHLSFHRLVRLRERAMSCL